MKIEREKRNQVSRLFEWNSIVFGTHLHTQWAAVTSQRSLIIDAPQKWPPRRVRLAMNGRVPRIAFSPPTIRPYRDPISLDSVAHDTEDTKVIYSTFEINNQSTSSMNHFFFLDCCSQIHSGATIMAQQMNRLFKKSFKLTTFLCNANRN